MAKKLLLTLLMLLILYTAANSVEFTSQEIVCAEKKHFTIKLFANPTTGYQWGFEKPYDKNYLYLRPYKPDSILQDYWLTYKRK